MIKKIIAGLALSIAVIASAEDRIVIGDTEITIPQVEGFQSIGPSHLMYDIMLNFVPPSNELLDIKITNSDIDAEIRGMEPEYNRYIVMQTYIPTKNRAVSKKEFEQLRNFLDNQYEEMTKAIQSQVDELAEKGSKKVSNKYSVEMATKITDNVPLEVFHNQGYRFSAMNLMTGNVMVDGQSESVSTTMGLNVLHVKEKIIYLYVYEESDSESARDWVKKMSTDFSNTIIEQ
ncbi:hypothetical protein [Kangiella aquimarina]|uniref:Uncharacterized protein n=1 Tax=Kangiella aquimarina TaxID=261965 RepID=A0ABZ0X4Z0_9GAMM|nr:hypothetical protein [Kangiella aquimarina]WQG85672.1 hypothetical protein SR900_02020 [Kangiella aquimarina]